MGATGALLLIGGGGFLLSKIDPQFDDFIGAGALKVQTCQLQVMWFNEPHGVPTQRELEIEPA